MIKNQPYCTVFHRLNGFLLLNFRLKCEIIEYFYNLIVALTLLTYIWRSRNLSFTLRTNIMQSAKMKSSFLDFPQLTSSAQF